MNFTNREKELLLSDAPVLSRITLYGENGEVLQVFNEDDYLVNWEYEDYRYVPNQGFIGQFVERLLDGKLKNIPNNISLENKEVEMEIAVIDPLLQNQVYHSYGRFMITKIEKEDTTGNYRFESSDYTKKFNVPFNGNEITYPCVALQLLGLASEQARVPLNTTDTCGVYITPEEGLPAGNYCFYYDKIYYEFTLENDLVHNNVIMVYPENIRLTTVDSEFNVTRTDIAYEESDDSDYELLVAEPTPYYDFINNDFVIENNQFEENDSCRTVVTAIAKLGYTWARINENNRLCLDFSVKDEEDVDTYDEIGINAYYEETITGDTVKPVNKVLIGMSNVDGENITKYSEDYTEENDSGIYIYDNPLTYTEDLRRIAINGAESLFGLTYTPMEVKSIGHPWLDGDEYIKVTNLEEDELYFYPFNRKINYSGVLTTDLSSQAKNEVQQKYENKDTVINRLTHTEIVVDKANQQINLVAKQVEDNTSDITNIQIDVNGVTQTVEHIENNEIAGLQSELSTVQQTMEAITNMFQISGGINVIRNSAFLLRDAVWGFVDNGNNPYHTPLGASYNVAMAGITSSVSEIKLQDTIVRSIADNITDLKTDGTIYTLNFSYKQDTNTTTTIRMYDVNDNTNKAFDDVTIANAQEFQNYVVSFRPSSTNYVFEIETRTSVNNGAFYLYDLMLNIGEKKSWQPASDEIYSTTLQMSRLGLQVYSVGDGTITLLGSDGLITYETTDGVTLGRIVSLRTADGDKTRQTTTQSNILTSDITNANALKWHDTITTLGGRLHKITYLETGE